MIKLDFSSWSTVACPLCGCEKFSLEETRFDSGRITRCNACGHLYLNPPIPPESLDRIYTESYGHPDEQFRREVDDWFSDPQGPYLSALEYLKKAGIGISGKRIFEIGAGAGRFLAHCRKEGGLVEGLDFFPKAVSIAKKYFDLDLMCCSIENAGKVPDQAYDFVFAFEIIEHLYNPHELLKLARRILKKGGYFVLSTPNYRIFKDTGDKRFASAPAQEHLHYFTIDSLSRFLGGYFEINKVVTVNPLLFGDRQKTSLINNKLSWNIWLAVRRLPLIFRLKETLFAALNRVRKKMDDEAMSGLDLLAIVQKR